MEKIFKSLKNLLLGLLISAPVFAQSGKLAKADKNFNSYNYQKAIEIYAEIAENNSDESYKEHVYSRLGDSYRILNDTKNAEIWYQAAVELPKCDSMTYYQYAQVLRSNEKYAEASAWLNRFLKTNLSDKEAIQKLAEYKNYSELLADSNRISVEFMDINTKMSDYSPSYYKNNIIFVSSRDTISIRRSSWNDEPFYSLYECQIDANNNLSNYKRLFGEINTKYHEGPVVFDNNTDILYFTRSNYLNGIKGQSKDEFNYLKIYQATEVDGKWLDIKELSFNNGEYSCAHPAISPDGQKLFFISDMPGGYGGTDIYYCVKEGLGWSKPINLGKPVNTLGNELFPSLSDNGDLYFASTGHPGLGGLDIFLYKNNKVSNLGYPINTSFDDFGLCTQNGNKGFFSSNRKSGFTNDDIYNFRINQAPVAMNDTATIHIYANNFNINPVAIDVLANDFDLNNNIERSKTNIIGRKNKKAISKIDLNGEILYLPQPGFTGVDSLKYVIFNDNNLSDTANVVIYVHGKNPPVAKLDSVLVQKNSTDNEIHVLNNDYDVDGDMVNDLVQVINMPENGRIEVENGMIKYTPNKDFTGKDYLIYQVFDKDGLKDKASLFINVQMLFLGKIVYNNLEMNLNINFETGKWVIKDQSSVVLDSIVKVLNENPTIEIELSAYTDSKGTTYANKVLSEKRAESAVAYIIGKGIDKKRLTAFAYGESEPLNRCVDGVSCSDEELSVNRRVNIKIVKY